MPDLTGKAEQQQRSRGEPPQMVRMTHRPHPPDLTAPNR
jgi:hypothetical protein